MSVRSETELVQEIERLREALGAREREAAEKERQLERYAADLRETFKRERARSQELRSSYTATVSALSNAVEARDAYTGKREQPLPGMLSITGVNLDTTHLISKRLEMLYEFVPADTKVAVLASPGRFSPEAETKFYKEKKMVAIPVNPNGELEDAFKAAVEQDARALLVAADPFYFNRRERIAALAAQYKIPALYPGREYAVAGGLLSYGPSISDAYRQIGVYAGRILNGARPEELPVVSPQKWELVINRKTAKALPLAIPPWLIARADETID